MAMPPRCISVLPAPPPLPPPPTATILGQTSVDEGASTNLSAGDPGGGSDSITYEWDANYNGSSFTADVSGPNFSFSAATLDGPSQTTVGLRVTDNTTGFIAISNQNISILNAPPVATFFTSRPGSSTDPQIVGFYGAADSAADMQAGFTYSYDFDNDGFFEIASSPTATAVVPASDLAGGGSHTIHGRITDKDGGFTDYRVTIPDNSNAPGNPTGDQIPPPNTNPFAKILHFNKRTPAVYTDSLGKRVTVSMTGPGLPGEVDFVRYGAGITTARRLFSPAQPTRPPLISATPARPTSASIQANSPLASITGAQVDLTGATCKSSRPARSVSTISRILPRSPSPRVISRSR